MSEFDTVAKSYSQQVGDAVSISGFGYDYFVMKKVEHLLDFVRGYFPATHGLRSLDIGAGEGQYSRGLASIGFQPVIADRSVEFLKVAQEKSGIKECIVTDATKLSLPDHSYDLVVLAMILHHIPVELWPDALNEAYRVLKPDGLVAIYEHNPWNPLTRRVMARLPFDADANPRPRPVMEGYLRNARFQILRRQYLFFFPALLRVFCPLERLLGWCPAGAQYVLIAKKRE